MTEKEKLKLLNWIGRQERLEIRTHYAVGANKKTVQVWTIYDDEDTPSGVAGSVLTALKRAMEKAQ